MAKRLKPKDVHSEERSPPAVSVAMESSGHQQQAAGHIGQPHEIEQNVRRRLVSQPELRFSTLVIHRTPNGVCLEGVVEADEGGPDVSLLAKTVEGVEEVLNHLVVRHPPAKG